MEAEEGSEVMVEKKREGEEDKIMKGGVCAKITVGLTTDALGGKSCWKCGRRLTVVL